MELKSSTCSSHIISNLLKLIQLSSNRAYNSKQQKKQLHNSQQINNSSGISVNPNSPIKLHDAIVKHQWNLLHFKASMTLLGTIAFLSHPIIVFLLVAHNLSFNGVVAVSKQNRDFDYFLLSLQWPGTNCRDTHKCCRSNACCRGSNAPKEFTIHGLWPNYNDGSWPSCCTNSEFDMKEISTLRNGLENYWPSLSCSASSTCHGHKGSFWAHEWEKHGTCAYPVIRDEYDYFRTALNLYLKYNVTKVLTEAGYVPSNSEKYPLGGIVSAIENAFHMTPLLVCSNGAVEELRLCFYKDFKPRDCVTTSSIREVVDYSASSCPKYVSLPTYTSSGRVIKVDHIVWILALFVIAVSL